jgi:hypothetical protein
VNDSVKHCLIISTDRAPTNISGGVLVSFFEDNVGHDRRTVSHYLDFDLVSGFVLTQGVGKVI